MWNAFKFSEDTALLCRYFTFFAQCPRGLVRIAAYTYLDSTSNFTTNFLQFSIGTINYCNVVIFDNLHSMVLCVIVCPVPLAWVPSH